jgi:hypothetical protein
MGDRFLSFGAAVQHGVAEHGRIVRPAPAAHVRRLTLEHGGDGLAQFGDLGG